MSGVTHSSPPAVKVALFRSLFRGREEVHARRFESRKTGRTGYSPACGNEWVQGVCDKPKVRCADCNRQLWLPVTDTVVAWHLSGRDDRGQPFVMGVYPMLLDEHCHFLAVDFDGTGWREDLSASLDTCKRFGLPVAAERSRSGNGAHLWLFFAEPLPAALARKLGSHILTETMDRRPEVGLASYDRLFPNQDTLPAGGFGNLIALPLQKQAREHGNSVFLDHNLEPHGDQWAFLDRMAAARIRRAEVEARVGKAERGGRILGVRTAAPDDGDDHAATPWLAPPSRRWRPRLPTGSMPERLDIVRADQLYVPRENLPPSLRNALLRLAAFQNPEFYRAQAMRLSTHDKPRVIACAEEHERHIGLPRGCLDDLSELLERLSIKLVIDDQRHLGRPLGVEFHGELRPKQRQAAEALAAHDTGVLAATTAFGKTVLAAWLIAHRGVNTLVVVHRRQLLEQWVERLAQFLAVPPESIGRRGGGRRKLGGRLDVALMQSLVRKGEVDDAVGDYGHLVIDECHHVPARSFELLARRAKARFVTGLTATVARKDGHHPIIMMQCGPVRHRVDARGQADTRPFTHEVLVRPTGFRPSWHDGGTPPGDRRMEFQALCRELMQCEDRNRLICAEVVTAVEAGRVPVVLTERTAHLERLEDMLRPRVPRLVVLRGGMARRDMEAAMAQLEDHQPTSGRVLLATGRFLGEGFDDARLDTLFLTMPVSWRGTIAQYAGRLHRLHHDKRQVRIHDYADLDVPMLERMFDRRCAGYEAVGYTILLPGSALPGWPVEVPLPVDPAWKQRHGAAVRRLIRDGVDHELASLFLQATTDNDPDGGPATEPGPHDPLPARSASEAFLFRRLETLEETRGRFRLNERLAIAFDDRGGMEVDLWCADARLAVEIDGPQHLGDEDAWRRDRRKDALLQQHDCLVLRFLASDLGARLDQILDTITRALAHQATRGAGASQVFP